VFNSAQPELSYLALAPNGADDDGALQAWEIGEMRLSHLQVVVLSACSTLNPRSSRTGSVAGLASSFLRAGAPGTISTLWDVTDLGVTELLLELHQRLADHEPAAEALRQAQLRALASPSAQLRAPRTWAAFTFTGS
jgi:CHAT domain-containing protein